jgi:hypothetical protein
MKLFAKKICNADSTRKSGYFIEIEDALRDTSVSPRKVPNGVSAYAAAMRFSRAHATSRDAKPESAIFIPPYTRAD